MPLIQDTLALAQDINTLLSDLALAMTGSIAADGSTPVTGDLNMNGHSIGGAFNINASNAISVPYLGVSISAGIAALNSPLNVNGQDMTNAGTITGVNLEASNYIGAPNGNIATLGVTNLSVDVVGARVVTGTEGDFTTLNATTAVFNGLSAQSGNFNGLSAQSCNFNGLTVQSANIAYLAGPLSANGQAITGASNIQTISLTTNALFIGDNGNGSHYLRWTADNWGMSWNQNNGATSWQNPAANLMVLDSAGNLFTRGAVSANQPITVLDDAAALDDILTSPGIPRALIERGPNGEDAVSLGEGLAMVLAAVKQLARVQRHHDERLHEVEFVTVA